MTTPQFNDHYEDLLKQLPPFMKKDVWLRLTTRKSNPLSEEQARGIRSDIEELLTREVNRYYKKKDHQKIKIEANTASDGSNTLSRLDGFEKQLEEREYRIRQQETNIKNTVEVQVAEEHKRLKDEYDGLKTELENKYNKCMIDMKQTTFSFKHQLEDQHKSRSDVLERQYKSRISVLDKANVKKDKEIGKLTSTISLLKKDMKDYKKSVEYMYQEFDDIIFAKDLKIIALNDHIKKFSPNVGGDATIEPISYTCFPDAEYWARKREDVKKDLTIRKKYTFRVRV